MSTDHDNKYDAMIDAHALELVGRVFAGADLDEPKVCMVALVSMLGSLLAIKAIEDDIDETKLDAEVKSLVTDIRHKTHHMHRLLRDKLKQHERDRDRSRTIH